MKRVLFLFTIFVLLLIGGCKKKVTVIESLPPPPPSPKVSEAQFLLGLGERIEVKNLKSGEVFVLKIPNDVLSSSTEVLVAKFKEDWTYSELLQILKEIPLTIVWVGREGSHLLIKDYFDLRDYYNKSEKFLVLDPKPVYSAVINNKEYWVSKDGKFWKTW